MKKILNTIGHGVVVALNAFKAVIAWAAPQLTNTREHAKYGLIAGALILIVSWLLGLIFDDYNGQLDYFGLIAFGLFILNWEKNQFLDSMEKPAHTIKEEIAAFKAYMAVKWLDTIHDRVVGFVACLLVFIAGGKL
jgi:hypothetical protein